MKISEDVAKKQQGEMKSLKNNRAMIVLGMQAPIQ